MAFNPDEYLKKNPSVFDPDAYLAKGSTPKVKEGAGRAALESYGNTATMGYLPQLQGALAKVTPDPNAKLDKDLKAKGFKIEQGEPLGYLSTRDATLKRLEQDKTDFPTATKAGTGAGMVGGALAGGLAGKLLGAGAQGLSAAQRFGQAAKTGAAYGALQNPGDVEGEISPGQFEKRAMNAGVGLAVGGVAQGAVEAIKPLKAAIGFTAKKLSHALTGVSDKEISTYVNRTAEINKLIKSSGGEVTEATDQVRTQLQNGIRSAQQKLRNDVSQVLAEAPKDRVISIQPIVEQLEKAKSKLNPKLDEGGLTQIDELISKVKSLGMDPVRNSLEKPSNDGFVSVQALNDIKNFMQDRGRSAYMRDGQIFNVAGPAKNAAVSAGAVARKNLNELAPDLAKANNQLSLIHRLEEDLNKNLIAPGKSDSALLAAGSGGNPRNAKMLSRLGDLTGQKPLEAAQNLAAVRTFARPQILPTDMTGKALSRQGLGAGIGWLIGGAPGAFIGGTVASPAALKVGINTFRGASHLLKNTPSVQKFASESPLAFQAFVNRISDKVRGASQFEKTEFDEETLKLLTEDPSLLDSIQDDKLRAQLAKKIGRGPPGMSVPKKK